MKERGINKKGQLTLFIILGIIIFAGIFAFIFWVQPTFISNSASKLNFDGCVEKVMTDSITELALTGGYINPGFSYIYRGQEIPYFIYTSEYYKPGLNQNPFPIKKFEEELSTYTELGIEGCYSNSISKLRSLGFDVVEGNPKIEMIMFPESVRVMVNAPTTISTEQYQEFVIDTPTNINGILEIVNKIVYEEALYGTTDTFELMTTNRGYLIQNFKQNDGTKIFTIEDKNYGTKYQFATRSYVRPAGFDSDALLVALDSE